ncbi:DDE-type integrase/transposase/recombinase [Bremerella sp.]|uniref:DDE-type integrase/transposase/recombinase n=1 Tax=Bremerella sp. TaxID=2795602 RepID=UPI00391C6B4A
MAASQTHGTRRIADELKDKGIPAARRTVAKILENQGLKGIQSKSFQPRTTESHHRLGYSPNHLLEDFSLLEINQLWVADITYVPLAGKRFAYLAMMMNHRSRRLIGWRFELFMTEELVLGALQDGIRMRRPPPGLIHHSDRGRHYAE